MTDSLWQDIRFAARSLRRSPSFTAAAVVTLALGIGATTSIFTVANATLLAAPPYPDADRLLVFTAPDGGSSSAQEFNFVRERSRTLAAISAHRSSPGWSLVVGSRAEFVEGVEVSEGYFDTLGVSLLIGRGISPAEAQPGGARTVVISEPLWRRVFSARSDVLGEVVELGGRPHTIVGVAPAGFRSNPSADVWTPLQLPPDSNAANQTVLGRIAPDRTIGEVTAEFDAMRPALRAALTTPSRARRVDFVTWMTYQEWMAGGIGGRLIRILLGAVGFLLLLACINVAGLQAARGMKRTRDFAARAALGASRARLFREALTESLLVAFLGAALGLVLAMAGTRFLLSLLSPDILNELLGGQSVGIDGRVIAVTVVLGALSAIVSGLLPAFSAATVSLTARVGQLEHHTATRRTVWLRRAFSVGQLAIAVVLLVGAGLLVKTFVVLRGAELGFNPESVLVGEMSIQGDRIDPETRNTFIAQALQAVRTAPGIEAAAVSNRVPVDVAVNLAVRATGEALITEPRSVDWTYVSDGYFPLLEIPLRAGRLFDGRDRLGAAPVAIVNEAFARAIYGRVNVVGESVQTLLGPGEPLRQIVGVVSDTKSRSNAGWTGGISALGAASPPILYVPSAQASADAFRVIHVFTPMRWIVKTRNPAAAAETVREAVRRVDPRRPFIRFMTMDDIIRRDLDIQRFLMMLTSAFSAIALTLAVIGLYTLVSYLVTQRTREIGVRMALGATTSRVLTSFLREGLGLGAAGLAIGLAGAAFATRAMVVFLVGVTPTDSSTLAAVAGLLLGVAAVATLVPARRAARLNPVDALRTE